MTQNQIAYQQLQETKRHNQVNEGVDIAKAALSPITTLIGTAIPRAKYVLGGTKSYGKR